MTMKNKSWSKKCMRWSRFAMQSTRISLRWVGRTIEWCQWYCTIDQWTDGQLSMPSIIIMLFHRIIVFPFAVSQFKNSLPTLRWPLLLHMCRREWQQSVLFRSNTQFCRSAQRIFPQCLRIGSGVQFLQSVYGSRWNVLGRWDPRNIPNQSIETIVNAQFIGISGQRVGWWYWHTIAKCISDQPVRLQMSSLNAVIYFCELFWIILNKMHPIKYHSSKLTIFASECSLLFIFPFARQRRKE